MSLVIASQLEPALNAAIADHPARPGDPCARRRTLARGERCRRAGDPPIAGMDPGAQPPGAADLAGAPALGVQCFGGDRFLPCVAAGWPAGQLRARHGV
jgi:hypothetical protein